MEQYASGFALERVTDKTGKEQQDEEFGNHFTIYVGYRSKLGSQVQKDWMTLPTVSAIPQTCFRPHQRCGSSSPALAPTKTEWMELSFSFTRVADGSSFFRHQLQFQASTVAQP